MTACSRLSLFLAALLCIQPTAVMGAQLAGSGDVLQMLKKIQGRWQSDCFPGTAARYQQETLIFSFTHVRYVVIEYPSSSCVKEVSRHSTKYQFILGDALETRDGRLVYAIDFVNGDDAEVDTLPRFNIVHYSDGELLLGRADSPEYKAPPNERKRFIDPQALPVDQTTVSETSHEQRLQRLDDDKPFRR